MTWDVVMINVGLAQARPNYTESVEVFVNYYTESVEVLATVVLSFNIPWQSDYSIHCVSSCKPKKEPDINDNSQQLKNNEKTNAGQRKRR